MYRIKQSIAKEDKTAIELKNEIVRATAELCTIMIRDIFDINEDQYSFCSLTLMNHGMWHLDTRVLVTDSMDRMIEVVVQGDVIS